MDDADEALQRALEILLRKAPSLGSEELVKWTQTVVKHEALAIRAERERVLASPLAPGEHGDWVALLPSAADGPAEKAERREAIARSREALQALKPQELRALTLLAEGYSYAEIGEITSWSQTKINRCLAEGRERFRSLISRSEDGRRCVEMRPLISAFCDGEADREAVTELREHLRACGSCRATLRAYRAAPAAAAALAPALSLHRSLLERAHDALTELGARFGGGRGGGGVFSQVAGGSGAGGIGAAAAAKVAAVCIGTAAGAAACVTAGLVPAPLDLGTEGAKPAALERRVDAPERQSSRVQYQPAPAATTEPEPKTEADPAPSHHQRSPELAPASAEPAPEPSEPASGSGAVEYAPPPAPEPAPVAEPAPAGSSGGGDPAGEFGP